MKKHNRWGKDNLRNHLSWVLAKGEDRLNFCDRILCPICKKEPVSQFSIRISRSGEASVGIQYVCCVSLECTQRLQAEASENCLIYPLMFSVIDIEDKFGWIQEDIGEVFRQAFKLSKDPSADDCFKFFSKGAQLNIFSQGEK